MKRYELIAPCHFGLEAVLKKEIIDLGYDVSGRGWKSYIPWRRRSGMPCKCVPADSRKDSD